MFFADSSADLNVSLFMEQKLEVIFEHFPKNAKILSSYASVVSMIARDDDNETNKIQAVNKGIELIDQAVSLDSHNSTVRLIHGHTSYSFPAMLNRQDIAREDYDFLTKCYNDTSCPLPKKVMAKVYFNRGDLYRQEGKINTAISYFKKTCALDPESLIAQKANKIIASLK